MVDGVSRRGEEENRSEVEKVGRRAEELKDEALHKFEG